VLDWRSKENIKNTQDTSKPNKALAIIAKKRVSNLFFGFLYYWKTN